MLAFIYVGIKDYPILWKAPVVTKPIASVICVIIRDCHNTDYLSTMTFKFDKCRRSLAVVTHVKYICNPNINSWTNVPKSITDAVINSGAV